jgi:hypothetical protein
MSFFVSKVAASHLSFMWHTQHVIDQFLILKMVQFVYSFYIPIRFGLCMKIVRLIQQNWTENKMHSKSM